MVHRAQQGEDPDVLAQEFGLDRDVLDAALVVGYLLLSAKQTTNDSVPTWVREPVAPLTSAHSSVPEPHP
ncbi:hypothetical protein ADK70_05505 [Streptomyces rimosus subsp. pseudoverticillatus]|nr:hypothetical protein ADK70_05505 [Streptomyces rimosus subsp. pseudoverticillatus]